MEYHDDDNKLLQYKDDVGSPRDFNGKNKIQTRSNLSVLKNV